MILYGTVAVARYLGTTPQNINNLCRNSVSFPKPEVNITSEDPPAPGETGEPSEVRITGRGWTADAFADLRDWWARYNGMTPEEEEQYFSQPRRARRDTSIHPDQQTIDIGL